MLLTGALSSFPQDFLQGDCTKARQKLNWKPRVTFDVSGLSGMLCTCLCPLKAIHREGRKEGDLCMGWLGHTKKSYFQWPPGLLLLQLPWEHKTSLVALPALPGKGPGSYQHFGKEWALVQGCQPEDIGCDLNRPVSSESCCSRAWAASGRAQQSPVPSLSWCGGVKGACHAPGCCLFIPCTEALICHSPSLQELVREMVDADVELMKNNPNAWALAGLSNHPSCGGFIAALTVRESLILCTSPPSTPSRCLSPHTSYHGQPCLD